MVNLFYILLIIYSICIFVFWNVAGIQWFLEKFVLQSSLLNKKKWLVLVKKIIVMDSGPKIKSNCMTMPV